MTSTITYTNCPSCGGENISEVLTCEDYTVSHETFSIWHCQTCTLRFTQNVPDAESIGPYYQSDAYISHSETGKGLINKLYKIARRYTLGSKRNFVQSQTNLLSGKLLDVGCGTGAFLREMSDAGWSVNGLEPDAGARAKAKELYNVHPQPSGDLFKLAPDFFEAITMWHVLEHVHDLHGYMQQLKKLLTTNGKLFIAVPNYTSTDATYYQQYWAAYDVPRHLYHFSPKSIKILAEKHGFKVKKKKPMLIDSFYIAMLSEQYKNGKPNLLAAMWQGFRSFCRAVINRESCSSIIYVLSPAQ
jgi:2-polyprenyl-3-methyl-5-hydroxy-6-metoxy-1,4-benzoquinol methylase